MIKWPMTSTNFNGEEITEDLYFNLTKAEIMEMELSVDGGFGEMMQRIVNAKDMPSMIKIFKELLLKSYGVKSPDGKRFIKNDALREEFSQTQAYSDLFIELSTNTDSAIKFVNGIVPQDMRPNTNDVIPANFGQK